MSLIKFFMYIEKRPLMYLREKNLILLESFINEYFLCQNENNLIDKNDEIFRNEFYY